MEQLKLAFEFDEKSICCKVCKFYNNNACPLNGTVCLFHKGKYRENRGKHGCYYNFFERRVEE